MNKIAALLGLVLFQALLTVEANGQSFTENFNGVFPPAGPPAVTVPIGTGSSDPTEVPVGEVRWYRSDNPILGTNVSGFTPNAGLNPGRGGSGFAAVFDSWAISQNGKADLIFNNINLTSFTLGRLSFYLKNTDGTDVLRVYARKTNTWVQIGSSSYGVYADWSLQTILLSGFSGPGNDTVDLRFECTSDNFGSNYGLDDVSLAEAPPMTYDSTSVAQITGDIFQASTRQGILRVEINSSGASPALTANNFIFNTNGTTNVADIKLASLYFTGSSSNFDTSVRVGNSISSPNGQFTFTGSNAITLSNQASKNYFWLCYDLANNATINNLVDAQFVSAVVGGQTRTPNNGNPNGSRTIKAPILTVISPAVDGNSSSSGRGPVSNALFHRSAALYTVGELSGLNGGAVISKLSYNIVSASNAAVSGNIKLYLANTSDLSFSRSTTWSSLISSPTAMKLVYTGPLTIPAATGLLDIAIDSNFVYTGEGLYVAFEWSISSAVATTNPTYECNGTSTLISGLGQRNAQGASLPSTLSNSSSLRPIIRLQSPLPAVDAAVQVVYHTGRIPAGLIQKVSACIKNTGASELTNYPVNLDVKGSNVGNDQKSISLPSLSNTVVQFNDFVATSQGQDTLTVQVGADNNGFNNSIQVLSSITSGELNYCYSNVADGSAGFGSSSGIMAVKYFCSAEKFVRSIKGFISNSNANVGNRIFGVIMDANGIIVGRTDTITISVNDLNAYKDLVLKNRVVINNANFYVGIGQLSNPTPYNPIGTQTESPLRAQTFFTSNINGASLLSSSTIGRLMIGCNLENVLPATVPNLGLNRIECVGYVLEAGTSGSSYRWSNGATTSSIVINGSGQYFVAVDNGQNLISTDTVILTIYNYFNPQVTLQRDPQNALCEGNPLTIIANVVDSGIAPMYEFYVNGDLVQSSSSDRYTSSALKNGDSVTVVFKPNSPCALLATDTSSVLIVQTLGTPSRAEVVVRASTGLTICSGTSVTFTADPVNGGSAPTYQWFINGVIVNGATSNTLTRSNIGNGAKISARMVSNSSCLIGSATVFDTVTMVVNSKPTSGYNATAVGTTGRYSFTNITSSTLPATYLWRFGNGATSTATNPTYQYTTPGVYQVKLIATNSCGSDSTTKIISVVIVGVEKEENFANIQVYPNPNEGDFQLELNLVQEDDLQLSLLAIDGRTLWHQALGKQKSWNEKIELPEISPGIYLLKINGTRGQKTQRIQIQ